MDIPEGGIAFFDSGIGGMTVLHTCREYLKNEVLYYYGDNIHAPYGNRAPEQIRTYVFRVFEKFRGLQVRAAVVACNTATAVCVEELRRNYDFPIIGAEPALKLAARGGGRVLVLTTQATCQSKRYRALYDATCAQYPQTELCTVPCEQLAAQIERNILVDRFDYTPFLPPEKADSVVLGCTHYVYIEEQIKNYYRCPIYHGNVGIARRLCTVLGKDRDGRPLGNLEPETLGFSTTNFPSNTCAKQFEIKPNKRSCQNVLYPLKNQGKGRLIFLGESAENNQKIYKQTYVCD